MKTYSIKVITFDENRLKFRNVEKYTIENGLVAFTDTMTGKRKLFPATNVEIEEE